MEEIYSVTHTLPDNGEVCLCFGHKTFCCKEDMEEHATWHLVKFRFAINSYRLKKKIPENIEESILDCYTINEIWDSSDEDERSHVIGVTQWKKFKK